MIEKHLFENLPRGWRAETVSEEDPRINPDSWRLGQVGMVGNVIKPLDQDGVPKGNVRVIFVEEQSKENPRDDLL